MVLKAKVKVLCYSCQLRLPCSLFTEHDCVSAVSLRSQTCDTSLCSLKVLVLTYIIMAEHDSFGLACGS